MTSTAGSPLEREIEQKCVRHAGNQGWASVKLDLAHRAWPDRMFLGPSSQMLLVEFKRPGEKPRKNQAALFARFEAMGHPVSIVTSFAEFKDLLDQSTSLKTI